MSNEAYEIRTRDHRTMTGHLLLATEAYSETVKVYTTGGVFEFYHEQDCCESVYVAETDMPEGLDVCEGEEIMLAEERVGHSEDAYGESETNTFYTIRSLGRDLNMHWYGTSNGYYSESVDVRCSRLSEEFAAWVRDHTVLGPKVAAWEASGGTLYAEE